MNSLSPSPSHGLFRVLTVSLLSFALLTTPLASAAAAVSSSALSVPAKSETKNQTKTPAADESIEQRLFANAPAASIALPQPVPATLASVASVVPLLPVGAVTATMTASFPPGGDVDGDGKADPGDTILYTVQLGNTTGTDATGLTFSDTIDSHTTLFGSASSTPVAFDVVQTPFNEGSSPVTITLSGQDPDGSNLTFSIVTPPDPNKGTLDTSNIGTVNCTNGICSTSVTYTLKDADVNGSDSFKFKVNDGTSDSKTGEEGTVSITINAVDDPPTFTKGADQTVSEDAGAQSVSSFITNISPGPTNESSQTVNFVVTSVTHSTLFSTQPTIDSTGKLTYTPATNANGTSTITYHALDNGCGNQPNQTHQPCPNGGSDISADQTFTIQVNAVNDAPVAQDKSFTAQANMKINGVNPSLLTGVTDPDATNGTNDSSSFDAANNYKVNTATFTLNSVTVGKVNPNDTPCTGATISSVASNGTFDFDPAPGFTGTCTLTYTVNDSGFPTPAKTSAPATITVTVNGPVIWFVNPTNASPATGVGTLSSPFTSLAQATTAMGINSNQRIFVYGNGTATAVGSNVSLQGNNTAANQSAAQVQAQWLIGQGVIDSTGFDHVFGITPPAGTIARPGVNGTRPTIKGTVTMHENTVVEGLNIDVSAGSTKGLTASGLAAGTSGSVLTIADVNVTSAGGNAVDISGSSNTNNSINYTTSNSSTSPNTISSQTGIALSVVNTTIGAGGMTFQSISAGTVGSGPTKGIVLNSTGSGSFSVTGTGTTAGSGGTIKNCSTRGAEFVTAQNITLKNMTFTSNGTAGPGSDDANCSLNTGLNTGCFAGVHLQSVTTATLDRLTVSDGKQAGISGQTVSGLTLTNSTISHNGDETGEDGVEIAELSGTNSIDSNTFTDNVSRQIEIINNTAIAPTITINNNKFSYTNFPGASQNGNTPPAGITGQAVFAQQKGSAKMTITLTSNTFTRIWSAGIQLDNDTGGSMLANIGIKSDRTTAAANTFTNCGLGATISGGSTGTNDFYIANNTFAADPAVTGNTVTTQIVASRSAGASGNWTGQIRGNTIGNATTGSGCNITSPCGGIEMNNIGASGSYHMEVTGNTVNHVSGSGILGDHTSGSSVAGGTTTFVITGNTVQNPEKVTNSTDVTAAGNAINITNGDNIDDQGGMCMEVSGNTLNGHWGNGAGVANDQSIRFRRRTVNGGSFKIRNYNTGTDYNSDGFTGTDADAAAFVASQNTFGAGFVTKAGTSNNSTTAPQYTGGTTACPLLLAEGGVEGILNSASIVADFRSYAFDASADEAKGEVRSIFDRSDVSASTLSQQQLDSIVSAAITRWSATGLTPQQVETLRNIKFEITDLGGSYLGEAEGSRILVDRNAGGKGWFVDTDPMTDTSFAHAVSVTRLYADSTGAPAGHLDLLTAVMHEMGHQLRLDDTYSATDRDNLMYGYLTAGERRLPTQAQARVAQLSALDSPHHLSLSEPRGRETKQFAIFASMVPLLPLPAGQTITIQGTGSGFKLPTGKTITITFQVKVKNPAGTSQISNHGTLSGSFPGTNPLDTNTVTTNVDLFNTTTTLSPASGNLNSGQSVTFTATVAFASDGPNAATPASGTVPTGTVNFKDNGSPLTCTNGSTDVQTLTASTNNSTATCTTSFSTTGSPHKVTATYSGDSNFETSSDESDQTVGKATPGISLASSNSSSFTGQSVTFTATLTYPNTGPVPTGDVNFYDDVPSSGTLIGTHTLVTGDAGVATFTTSGLTTGTHHIKAQYTPGDSNFNASAESNIITQTVSTCSTSVVVTSPNDSGPGTLRDAMGNVCPDGTITFAPALTSGGPATISLLSALPEISANVTITGPGASLLTVERSNGAGSQFRIFKVNSGVTASISGLTIAKGRAAKGTDDSGGGPGGPGGSGGGIYNSGTLTLSGVVVNNNFAGDGGNSATGLGGPGGSGGGIFNDLSATLTINNSTISNNHTGTGGTGSTTGFGGVGGGIYSLGDLTITNSTINGNKALGTDSEGGGIDSEGGTFTLTNSTISGNTSDGDGGGLLNCGSSNTTLTSVTITGNSADANDDGVGDGGGIRQISSNPITLRNTIVAGNFKGSVLQVETATVVGTITSGARQQIKLTVPSGAITSPGDATVKLTAAGINGGVTKNYTVPVSTSDDAHAIALNIKAALDADTAVFNFFNVTVSGADVTLTAKASAAEDGTMKLSIDSCACAGLATPTDSTETVAGQSAGDATVTVTAANFNSNNPKTLNVPVALDDTASDVAGKMRTALAADSTVNSFFTVSGSGAQIVLTVKTPAANDTTLNIATDNGTSTGLTTESASTDTTPGSATAVASDIFGSVDGASSFNLIGTGGSGGLLNGSNNNQVGADPKLGPLADNGGPTQTHAFSDNTSPAIDQGSAFSLTTDQRGFPRPVGSAADIGAFEKQVTPTAPTLSLDSLSDTGPADGITADTSPTFNIGGLTTGATVELLRDGNSTPVATGTASGASLQLTDNTGALSDGTTYSYTAHQTLGGLQSNESSPAVSVTIDTTAPGVLISTPSTASANASTGTVSYTVTYGDANLNAITLSAGDITLNKTGTANASVGVSGSGNTRTVTLSNLTGTGTLGISIAAGTATDKAGNTAGAAGPSATFNVDVDSPTVALSSAAPNPTNSTTIPVSVTFSEAVSGFDLSGVTVSSSPSGKATKGNFQTIDPSHYTFDITITGTGIINVSADIGANVATDTAGNGNTAAVQLNRTYNDTNPTATFTPVSPNPRNTSVSSVQIVFSKPVTGVDHTDFTLTRDGVGVALTASQDPTTSDNITWTMPNLSGLTGTAGTYVLKLTASGSGIKDSADNLLQTDATTTWGVDTTPPSVTVTGPGAPVTGPTSSTVINFTVTFNEPVNGFDSTDVSLPSTPAPSADATVANVTQIAPNDGTTYNVGVEGMTQSGSVTITIPDGSATDAAGNGNIHSGSLNTATVQFNKDNFTTLVVNSTDDPGDGTCDPLGTGDGCTLREAINAANGDAGAETISFDPTVFNPANGSYTINLTGALPDLSTDMTIQGPGANVLTVRRDTGTYRIFTVTNTGTVTISGLTISNGNGSGTGGGGILNSGTGTLNVSGSTISGNSTGGGGGGIQNFSTGTVNVSSSTISGNSCSADGGGGIQNNSTGTVSVINSTLSGNTATGYGGGILNSGTGTLNVSGSTISGNSTGSGGGGIRNFSTGPVNVKNTIIAGNTAPGSPGPDVQGTFTSQGFNLIGKRDDSAGFTTLATDQTGTAASPLVAGLDPAGLQNNGGPTKTIKLQCTSPAIDKGSSVLTTLNGGISGSDTTVNVNNGGPIPAGIGFTILVDAEQMIVTGKSGNALTVSRGANGTTATAHSSGASVLPANNTDQRGFTRPLDFSDSVYPNQTGGDGSDIGAFESQSGGGCLPIAISPSPQPSTNEDTAVIVTMKGTFTQNTPLSFTVTQQPSNGLLSNQSSPTCSFDSGTSTQTCTATIKYTPNANFNGADLFKFKVSAPIGGGTLDSDEADVNITVNAVNDAPVAGSNQNMTVDEDPTTPLSITLTGTDVDSASLTFNITNPSHGTLSVPNVTCPSFGNCQADLTYTPAANFNGTDSFTYRVSDGTALSAPPATTISINVHSIADTPSVTNATTAINKQTTSGLVITRSNVDGPEIGSFKITNIKNGTLFKTNGTTQITDGQFITAGEGATGLKFTPDHNLSSPGTTFSFDVQGANNAAGDGLGPAATATITVNCGAATVVTNTNDSGAGSLRDVVTNACPGNTITFNIPTSDPGFNSTTGVTTITLTSGELLIDRDLTITGTGANKLTVARSSAGGTPDFRIFNVTAGTIAISGLNVSNGKTSGNTGASGNGGGILNSGTLTLSACALVGNTSSLSGGAIDNRPGATLTVTGCTLSGNIAGANGAVNNGGNLNIANSTISGNSGGGLANSSNSATIINSTITGNNSFGILTSTISTTSVGNTIVAKNGGSSDLAVPVGASFNSLGNNLIGASNAGTGFTNGVNGDKVGTLGSPIDPLLLPLADNGGPVQTHLLLPGSPAVNAGSNTLATNAGLTTDERGTGFARVVNTTVDIGAVEVSYANAATAGTPQSATINAAFGTQLKATIKESGNLKANVPVTFTAPSSGASGTFQGSGATITVNTDSNGVATAPTFTANGTAGSYNVVASLATGQPTSTFALTNNAATTQTALASSVNPSDFNQSVTFTATVTSTAGTPTGLVQFKDNGTALGSPVALSGGVATFTTSTLAIGTHPITADYAGDGNFLPSSGTIAGGQVVKSQLSIADVSLTEGDSGTKSFNFTVTLSQASTVTAKVDFATSDGTAKAGSDYVATSGTLVFNPGDTQKTITVLVNGDTLNEPDETFFVTLSNPVNATITQAQATGTIKNDDGSPSLSINDVTLLEGNSGTTDFTFTVTLSAASGQTVTVQYATLDGTATVADSDYQAASGTLTFNPGETTKTITVKVVGDTKAEADETFFVNLTNATNAPITRNQGVGTILSDDTPLVQLSAAAYNVKEDGLHATITVKRLGDLSRPATVDYATSDPSGLNDCSKITGNASQRCDYAISVGTLRYAAGEDSKTIFVPIVNDVYVEGPEFFTISLSNPVGAELGAIPSARVNIIDDDNAGQQNPVVDDAFFIRQLYIDFLDREPEPAGLQGWLDILHNTQGQCKIPTDCDRIAVALGFVRSPEFQDRGYFIFRFYSTALGRNPGYFEFMNDMARVSGFLNSSELEANKSAFVDQFMSRQEFKNLYDVTLNDPAGYVDKLLKTVGLPNHPSRNGWVVGLQNGTLTRAQVLRQMIESTEVYTKFYNQALIVMQYFGFLRRDPDAAYQQWIEIFNHSSDYRILANGFINSPEYPTRFGP